MIKKKEKELFYYKNGDREMGNYLNDKKIGKHATLHVNGNITLNKYK